MEGLIGSLRDHSKDALVPVSNLFHCQDPVFTQRALDRKKTGLIFCAWERRLRALDREKKASA